MKRCANHGLRFALMVLAASLLIVLPMLAACGTERIEDPVEANSKLLVDRLGVSDLTAGNAARLIKDLGIDKLTDLEIIAESSNGWRFSATDEDGTQYYMVLNKRFGITLITENDISGKVVFSADSPIPQEDLEEHQQSMR